MLHLLTLAMLALPVAAHAASAPALTVAVAGPAVTVFVRQRDGCGRYDTPDAPARAVRTQSGEVALFATHFDNRALRGPSLHTVRPDCHITFQGAEDPDPARFSDRAWITALWTRDGLTIHAIVHNEHQGHRHPGQCPSRQYRDCWFNALTAAVSTDGGRSFHPAGRPPALVAALPYTAQEMRGQHAGYFNPTGIVSDGKALLMLAFTEARGAQRRGNCLLRTETIEDPAAWRAWDGRGFGVVFINPYAHEGLSAERRARHVCTPVGVGRLQWPVTSLVHHTPSGLFVAAMLGAPHRADRAEPAPGIYVATSADLITWSAPALVLRAIGHGRYRCGDEAPIAYPSLLDTNSTDPSFATIGAQADLYFTRFNVPHCRIDGDRDLVRIPVRITLR